jgi:hypothetical protein
MHVVHYKVLHEGRLLALPTNITLSWKGLPGTNTLACDKSSYITAIKKFYNIDTWVQCYKTVFVHNL